MAYLPQPFQLINMKDHLIKENAIRTLTDSFSWRVKILVEFHSLLYLGADDALAKYLLGPPLVGQTILKGKQSMKDRSTGQNEMK